MRSTASHGNAGCVNSHIAAADHHDLAGNGDVSAVGLVQKVDGGGGAGQRFPGDAGQAPSLAADGHVKALVPLLAQLGDGDVLAHLHTGANLYANLAHDVNLRLDDVLLQFIGRNAVAEHAARLLIALKDGGLVALGGQVIGTGKTGRTAADNGNLLGPAFLHVGADVYLRHKTRCRMEVLFCNKFLYGVDGNSPVDGAARAGVFAAPVADAAAHRRERIFALDELQRLRVFALRSLLQVALDGNMGRAGRFTGRCPRLIAVDAVFVPIVLRPFVLAPGLGIRKLMLGILDGTVVGAELLAQFDGARRAVFHAAAAGDAVFRLDLRYIGAAAHIGRVKQLRGAQGIANLYITVADGKDFSFAVNVGYLVHKAVVFRLLEDGHGFVVGDVVAAAGLPEVVRHVAHADTPVPVVVCAAFVQLFTAVPAAADTYAQVSLILFEPVGDVFDIDRLVLHGNGFFYGNYVHANSGAAHGHHGGDFLQREEGHALEEHGKLWMLVHELHVHVGVFCAAGHEHRYPVNAVLALKRGAGVRALAIGVMVSVIVLQHAKIRQFVQQGIEVCFRRGIMLLAVEFMELVPGPVLAHFERIAGKHVQEQVQRGFAGDGIHLVLEDTGQAPVLRCLRGHFDFAGNAVRDVADQLNELGIGVFVTKVLGDKLFGHLRHIEIFYCCFQSFTRSSSHPAKASTPSPVLAQMGIT